MLFTCTYNIIDDPVTIIVVMTTVTVVAVDTGAVNITGTGVENEAEDKSYSRVDYCKDIILSNHFQFACSKL